MKRMFNVTYIILGIVLVSCKREKDYKIEYFPTNEIKSISHYKNGILNGETVWFFKSGIIEQKHSFKAGKLDGYSFYFYPSGCLSGYRFYERDTILYGLDYHDEPQLIIKSILQYNDKGQIIYKKNFDEHGIFLSEEGSRPQ